MITSNVFRIFATVAEMSQMPQRRCDCEGGEAVSLFRAHDYITRDEFQIVQCSSCGLAFTEPVPQGLEWRRYYPDSYYGDAQANRFPRIVEWLQNRLYASRARKVERLANGPGRVLDIGCGRGFLLRSFQRRGWDVAGTEMSESAAAYARQKLDLPVHVGKFEEVKLPENSFDAVVMWHVLEHFERVDNALREVNRVLKPGGIFLVAVPNFGSLEARLARDKWFHLDVPRHLTHFTSGALARCLVRNRFQVETGSVRSLEYDFFSAMQSFLNRIGLRHNWFYNFLRKPFAERGAAQAFAHLVCAPIAGVVGCVPLLAGGSTLIVYARKL